METMMNYLLGCLCLFLLLILGKFLYIEWWTPNFIQSLMRSQGIKGPSYRFLHGNTKEITNMRNETMKNPMELSHHVLPRIQPHIYSWIKLYGKYIQINFELNFIIFFFLNTSLWLQGWTSFSGMVLELNWQSQNLSWLKKFWTVKKKHIAKKGSTSISRSY